MAITSVAEAILGAQQPYEIMKTAAQTVSVIGNLYTNVYQTTHRPPGASAPTPGLAGEALTAWTGQIPYPAPANGSRSYLYRFGVHQVNPNEPRFFPSMWLIDRMWHNSGIVITTTGAQTVNSVAFPARDLTGTTDGAGVMVALEVSSTIGAAGPITNTTMSYTNSAGASGRTATNVFGSSNPGHVGYWMPFRLDAGDTGVRSIQSLTLGTSYSSGTIHLVAYRTLLHVPSANNNPRSVNFIEAGCVRLFDNSVLQMVLQADQLTLRGMMGFLQVTNG